MSLAALLWLHASEFGRRNWSVKAMHRLLMTSSAYRMESSHDAACAEKDTDNRLVWRMNPRRMEAVQAVFRSGHQNRFRRIFERVA